MVHVQYLSHSTTSSIRPKQIAYWGFIHNFQNWLLNSFYLVSINLAFWWPHLSILILFYTVKFHVSIE